MYITGSGNLARKPRSVTTDGQTRTYATVICNSRRKDDDGTWITTGSQAFDLVVSQEPWATNLLTAADAGNIRIDFAGPLKVEDFETDDGRRGTDFTVYCDQVAVSLIQPATINDCADGTTSK